MPDLHDLLTGAVPPVEPGFDATAVRERAAAADRRARRVVSGVALSVVALVAVVVVSGLLGRGGVRPASVGDLVPLEEWPSRVVFAGVEVGIHLEDEPDELMQHRIALGDGEAALNIQPSDAVEPGNPARQMVVARLWFSCGTDQVVRAQEIGPVPDAPASAGGRWLPVGALVEAAQQLVARLGCTPTAPDGTPSELHNNHNQIHQIAAAIDRAGLLTCCASVEYDPVPSATTFGGVGLRTRWTVFLDEVWLPLRVDHLSQVPTGIDPVLPIELAGGQGVTSPSGEGIAVTCGMATIQVTGLPGREPVPFTSLLQRIGCTPAVPEPLRATAAAVRVLDDLGARVLATPYEPAIGTASVEVDGSTLLVRAGGSGQVGLSEGSPVGSATGATALDPAVDGMGAAVTCTITWTLFADDEPGADIAMDLAERIAMHPGCDLYGVFDAGPGEPLPMEDDEGPEPASPPIADRDPGALAQRVADALDAAGLSVDPVSGDEEAAAFGFQPSAPGTTHHGVGVEDISQFPIGGGAQLILLGEHGEAAHLGDGVVVFHCDGHGFSVAGQAGAVEVEAILELLGHAGCEARPPGITASTAGGRSETTAVSIREARLFEAFEALGADRCCGEPSHGGAGASTGMIWEGSEVFLTAGPPTPHPAGFQTGEVIDFAGGQADLGDGDSLPLIAFDCGDTRYLLQHDTTNTDVHLRAAEALVGQLGCTPTVG